MVKLAISGCQGRMGLSILHLAQEDNDFKITCLLENKNHPAVAGRVGNIEIASDPKKLKNTDVLIEFTSPDATMKHIEACLKHNVKMVIGTTGLNENQINKITAASTKIPIVFSSNMSVGVNILFGLAKQAAAKTTDGYDLKIVEAHHIHKKDAPSGTAKTIAKIIQEASGKKVDNIESIREDEIIGDHTVTFESAVDTITISHHAKTRDIFAAGALRAAKFVAKKNNGLFTMQDALSK